MSDDRKVMNVGVIVAAAIIVARILLELAGMPQVINNIFGVAWLYLIIPVLFALGIRAKDYSGPYKILLKDVILFAVYTRAMVMVTYMAAYFLKWEAPRFSIHSGGVVGDGVSALQGLVIIPVRNALIWIVTATIVGMIIGSVTLLLKRKAPQPAAA
jgi:hypothetical protein